PRGTFFIKILLVLFRVQRASQTGPGCSLPGSDARKEDAAILYVWQGQVTQRMGPAVEQNGAGDLAPLCPQQEKYTNHSSRNTGSSLGWAPVSGSMTSSRMSFMYSFQRS